MKKKSFISETELTEVMINLICAKLLLHFPGTMIKTSGNAAWLQGIYIFFVSIILFYVTGMFYRSDKTVIEIAESSAGKTTKRITALAISLLLIANAVGTVRVYCESVKIILLKDEPLFFIIFLFCIGIFIGVYNGIASLCRINSLFLPVMGIIFAGAYLLILPLFRLSNFAPVFGNGASKIFGKGTGEISFFSDIIALNFLKTELKNRCAAPKCGKKAIIVSFVAMMAALISLCAVFPQNVSGDFVMPVYQLTRILEIGDFFTRFEAFFEFVWSFVIMINISVYCYVICNVIRAGFDLRYYRPLAPPVILICVGTAFLPGSVTEMLNIYDKTEKYIGFAPFIILILFGTINIITEKRSG